MKINAILIDDERKALAILRNKIERFCPSINIIAESQSPKESIGLIQELQPQLIFLDIAMPLMSGFDLLKAIEKPMFEIIFVTAFDNYAIEAINHCALGYLVKPVKNELLIEAVNKAIENIKDKSALEKNKILIENLGVTKFQDKKIVVPSHIGLEFIKIADIIYFEGTSGYTKIHITNKKTLLSSNSIGHFNKLIKNKSFYLIHKSYLINLNYIEKYLNEGYVQLENNIKLQVARGKKQDFLNHLK